MDIKSMILDGHYPITFDDFCKYIVENIKNYLPDEYKEAQVLIQEYAKVNKTVKSLVVRLDGEKVAQAFPLNGIYEDFMACRVKLESICSDIAQAYTEARTQVSLDMNMVLDREYILSNVQPKLISSVMNKGLLENTIYVEPTAGLAEIFYVDIDTGGGLGGSVTLSKAYCEDLGITTEELAQAAGENLAKIGYCYMNIGTRLLIETARAEGIAPDSEEFEELKAMLSCVDVPFDVLSNNSEYGASVILSKEICDEVAEKIGDFIIMPSSVKEVLVIPKTILLEGDDDMLADLVHTVNADAAVMPKELFLSDSVYQYTSADGLSVYKESLAA